MSSLKVRAVYKQGSFVPESPCALPENSVVELTVESAAELLPPTITDPAERERVLERLLDRMQRNPIPAEAPRRWNRDELHDRG